LIGKSFENANILRRAAMQRAWQTGEAARTTGGRRRRKMGGQAGERRMRMNGA